MKTFAKFLTVITAAAFVATGCVSEDPPYKPDPKPDPEVTTGFLSFSKLSVEVNYDETEIRTDDTMQEGNQSVQTRAEIPDVNNFIVEIFNANGDQVLKKSYAELLQDLATPMELTVGTYTINVKSEEEMPEVDWEHPFYGTSGSFTILKAQTTTPETLTCTLQNIKVSVEYSAELAAMLADTSKTTLSLDTASEVFLKTDSRAAYFKPTALENTLVFAFDGTFADTGASAKFNKQITGVKAGQWRKISVVIDYADKGTLLFSIRVDNSILQNNEFVSDGTKNLIEEVIDDPKGPSIEWPSHDLTQPFTLTEAMFDENGNCTEPFVLNLSAPNGIESLQVAIGSTNSLFLNSMTTIGLPSSFDLCTLDSSTAAGIILRGFGYTVGSDLKGKTAQSFDIAGQMKSIFDFAGTHTFVFTATDTQGIRSTSTLTLVIAQRGIPTIVWRNHDIDQQYTIEAGLTIDVDINAPAGIKSFFVTIDSDELRPLLPVINLPEKFDICNIPDNLVEILHEQFGFPVNDQVKDQTSVTFSITKFVEILLEIKGGHNFILDVTDNNGALTTKTVKLVTL